MHCARLILISSFLLSFANFALSQTNDLTHRPQAVFTLSQKDMGNPHSDG